MKTNYLQGESLRAAKSAERKGDYQRAGDLYLLGGDEAKGMEMYLKGHDYGQAAKILEDREHYGAAAHCYAQAGNFVKAGSVYLRMKDFEKAAFFFEKGNEAVRASDAWIEAGNLVKAAEIAERGDRMDRAAELYERSGDLLKAADLYRDLMIRMGERKNDPTLMEGQSVAIKKFGTAAGNLYFRLQDYIQAADCFLAAGNMTKAANSYRKAQRYDKAADLYTQIEDFHSASEVLELVNKHQRASWMAEKAGEIERAAMLAQKSGQTLRAATLFAQANKLEQAAELYFQLLIQSMDRNSVGAQSTVPTADRQLAQTCGSLYLRLHQHAKAGWCYERAGDSAKAAACYSQGNLFEKAAEMYATQKDYAKAMEYLTKAGDMQNKSLLAEIYFHAGRFEEAASLFMTVERLDRAADALESAGQFLKAALLYEQLAQFGKAAALLEKANENTRAAALHEQAGQFLEAAQMYEAMGDLEGAGRCAAQTGDRLYTGNLLIKRGKLQEAVTLLQSIGNRDLQYREACRLLGEVFVQMDMNSLAIQKFTEAVGSFPISKENIESNYGLARALEKTGESAKALELFEKILAIQFDFQDVLQRVKSLKKTEAKPKPEPRVEPRPEPNPIVAQMFSSPAPPSPKSEPKPEEMPEYSFTLGGETTVAPMGFRIRDYEILQQLGQSAMSRIYRARHMYLRTERAIKVIRRSMIDAESTDRFLREARILNSVHHPNLVQLHEFGSLDNGVFFMVLELVLGESAYVKVKRDGPMPFRRALQIAREAAMGLKAAHEKGIIHRDVCPENLILTRDADDHPLTKVVDFGVAKILVDEATSVTSTTAFLGKPQYSSPEQCGFLKEGSVIDERTDIYSLAVTLHYLLTGSLPFTSPTPQGFLVKHLTQKPVPLSEAMSDCPEGLSAMVLKAMSVDPEDRQAGMGEFISDLDQV